MSQWRRRDSRNDDPSRSRQSRSSAMASDLIPGSPPEEPSPGVPQWLVDEQRALQRNAPPPEKQISKKAVADLNLSSEASSSRGKSAPPTTQDAELMAKGAPDDDLIVLDMLDGAHVPTRTASPGRNVSSPQQAGPIPTRLSITSDSILSLPAINAEPEGGWKAHRAEAQQRRRLERGGQSMSGVMPRPYMKGTRGSSPESSNLLDALPFPLFQQSNEDKQQSHTKPPPGAGTSSHVRPSTMLPASESTGHVGLGIEAEKYREIKLPGLEPGSEGSRDVKGSGEAKRDKVKESMPRNRSRKELKGMEMVKVDADAPPRHSVTLPLLDSEVREAKSVEPPKVKRTRGGSVILNYDTAADDDLISIGNSSVAGKSNRSRQTNNSKRSRRNRRHKDGDDFRPSAWGWQMPAEEDAVMPSGAWIYLPLIGWLTFMLAYIVNTSSQTISEYGINPLAAFAGSHFGERYILRVTAGLRGLMLAASFIFILFVSPQYTAGSGIPEMKCVLSGVLMPRMLNWKTLCAKMVGLIFALSSGISIGRLGPFIHMSGITAALVSKIPWFPALRSSARYQLQALSAAMAAGVGATFGAPIGGTMLSIEVMSLYYYIHWLPMALYCSIMGYYFVVSLVQTDTHAFFHTSVSVEVDLESFQRLLTYIVLGALCGVVGAALVQFTKTAFQLRQKFFTTSTPVRTTIMVMLFAVFHTYVVFTIGGVLMKDQKLGVEGLFNERTSTDSWLESSWQPFAYSSWNSFAALVVTMFVKFFLTGLSLVMPVPAGTFMPIFELGALLGRAFGEFCNGFSFVDWVDPRATAIVGAAALTSGALHTTSVAVVMLELTREAIDVLPLAVGVIVSYGVSKQLCSDLFSELIKIRRLPFILGLRERYPSENRQFFEDVAGVVAGTFMDKAFPFVTPESTKGEIYAMLNAGGRPWINCAFLSDAVGRRLWGTVSQQSLWDALGDDFEPLPTGLDEELGYGAMGGGSRRRRHENELVPFLKNFDPEVGSELVDMGPMQVSYHTPFWKIITFFRMLSMGSMYVMRDGVTVGFVSKAQVISHSIGIEARAKRVRENERAADAKRKRDYKELVQKLRKETPQTNRLASRLSEADLASLGTPKGNRSRQNSYSFSRR